MSTDGPPDPVESDPSRSATEDPAGSPWKDAWAWNAWLDSQCHDQEELAPHPEPSPGDDS